MENHLFLLSPGVWLGEGKIHLNLLQEELEFFTRWRVKERDLEGVIECEQEIMVKGMSDVMTNVFLLSSLTPSSFSLFMENHAVGTVQGTGIINGSVIGWEFRSTEIGFEGFEFYEKKADDTYEVRAEFTTSDQLRTIVHGKIRRALQAT